jgi:hypothetical protein
MAQGARIADEKKQWGEAARSPRQWLGALSFSNNSFLKI